MASSEYGTGQGVVSEKSVKKYKGFLYPGPEGDVFVCMCDSLWCLCLALTGFLFPPGIWTVCLLTTGWNALLLLHVQRGFISFSSSTCTSLKLFLYGISGSQPSSYPFGLQPDSSTRAGDLAVWLWEPSACLDREAVLVSTGVWQLWLEHFEWPEWMITECDRAKCGRYEKQSGNPEHSPPWSGRKLCFS